MSEIQFSSVQNPHTWNVQGGILEFATPEDAKRAEELFDELAYDFMKAKAELDAAQKDAARYRKLRSNGINYSVVVRPDEHKPWMPLSGAWLDDFIDGFEDLP